MEELDSYGDNLSENKLREFEKALKERLPFDIQLILVSNSPENASEIKDKLLNRIEPVPKRIVFDITHAYRYMPYVAFAFDNAVEVYGARKR
ncbi:MAG: TM1812 family CRISPR-associated protein [Aquificota bacterium]|nr:TM1812 family CRISPR-associated protein [Aquificota bacterium]